MIVSEQNITDALTYLAIDPHPVALARKDLTDAENDRERMFSLLYSEAEGTVRDRECKIENNPDYQEKKSAEADAEFELERHKARIRAAEMLISVWQSEGANARAAEKVR